MKKERSIMKLEEGEKMETEKEQYCENCKHGIELLPKDGTIKCHRYPPQITSQFPDIAFFPTVQAGDHCGEYIDRRLKWSN